MGYLIGGSWLSGCWSASLSDADGGGCPGLSPARRAMGCAHAFRRQVRGNDELNRAVEEQYLSCGR